MELYEIMKILAPLIALEWALKAYCLIKMRNDTVLYFDKNIWILIILLISIFGPILYLAIGREK